VSARQPTLLVVQHVPWEGPHRIADACGALDLRRVSPLESDALPDHAEVAGTLVMGGPMNVDDLERYPALATEREWLAEAVRRELPVLGVCLGAQLLARALGAEVRPGEGPEIGFADVAIHDPADPILGGLAPSSTVLHWHGDVFDLPPGARPLASSAQTEHQAFRAGNAWGLLFHAEADAALVETWLREPTMAEEARQAIGEDATSDLPRRARQIEPDLIARSQPGFEAFARLVAEHSPG
jgi:GMP synthase (glutamine-hydrolysing)